MVRTCQVTRTPTSTRPARSQKVTASSPASSGAVKYSTTIAALAAVERTRVPIRACLREAPASARPGTTRHPSARRLRRGRTLLGGGAGGDDHLGQRGVLPAAQPTL